MKPFRPVRFRFSHWLPGLFGAGAITLYPWVLFADPEHLAISFRITSHEMVHVEQVRRMGWVSMYWRYFVDYLALRVRGHGHSAAYALLPMELEAYDRAKDEAGHIALHEAYLKERARSA